MDMRLSFLRLLPVPQPVVQQLDDDPFHLLGCVGSGEVLLQRVMAECDGIVQRLLFLRDDLMNTLLGERAFLALLFDSLRLGEGRRLLGGFQCMIDPFLLFRFQVREFYCRRKAKLTLVYLIQERLLQIGQADEALDLPTTVACCLAYNISAFRLPDNLSGSITDA